MASGTLVVRFIGDLREFERATKSFSGKLTGLGRSLTTGLTLPLIGLGVAAVKTFTDFESEMSKIQGLVGLSAQEVQGFSDVILTEGPKWGRPPQELAEAMFFVTSAGLKGADALDVLEMSAKAASAGLGDTATIADLVTSTVNAYGTDVIDAAGATDVLTAAVREGKLEADQLAGAMGRTLPIASSMGISFDEVGAAFAAMSRTGTDANEAATQLRAIMTSLLKPGTQAKDTLKEMGLSAKGLRQQIRDEGLLSVLETLAKEFKGNEDAAAKVFPNVRALSGVMDLMGANADTTRTIFGELADSTGALDSAFGEAEKTARFKFDAAMAEVQASLIQLGADLAPIAAEVLPQLAAALSRGAEIWNNFGEGTKRAILIVAGIAAVLGPALIVIGTMIKSVGAIAGAIKLLAPVIPIVRALAVAIGLVGKAMLSFFLSPVGLVILAIAALVVGIVLLIKHWDKVKAATAVVWNFIKKIVGKAVDFLVKLFLNFTVPGLIIKHWGRIRAVTVAVFNAITAFIARQIQRIINFVRRVRIGIGIVRAAFGQMRQAAANRLRALVAFVRSLPRRIRSALGNLGSLLWQAGRNIIQGLINGIRSMLGAIADAAGDVASTVRNYLPFSPAKTGPLSGRGNPMFAGQAIADMVAAGMTSRLATVSAASADMAAATRFGPTGPVGAGAAGVGGGVVVELHSDGTRIGDLLIEILRKAIRIRGGTVQTVLGRNGG